VLQREHLAVDNLHAMRALQVIPSPLRSIIELVLTLAVAVALALAAQAFVVKPYRVPTPSMVPTLEPGDRVLADRLTLRFRAPHRGEIVVFHPPTCDAGNTSGGVCTTPNPNKRTGYSDQTFIKRVIGLPGETLFSRNGHVWVRSPGQPAHMLNEPYVHGEPTSIVGKIIVPQGSYFLMGDHRENSDDSRVWGPEPRSEIIGIARIRYWPLDRIGVL
jgi:signal peptidase I